jgi:hemoglobin
MRVRFAQIIRKGWKSELLLLVVIPALAASSGCGSTAPEKKKDDAFFTSGNPEADQRARTTVREDKEKPAPKKQGASAKTAELSTNSTEKVNATLYDRLGGEPGITAIVDDFIKRAIEDPRVNWTRQGITKGSWWRLTRPRPVEWNPTPENVSAMKKHFVQFISLAAGGPAKYEGKEIKPLHADMQITKPEFDAAIGDLKASLDKLQVAPDVQKELLSVIESTRPLIVPER